ncbi:MAG: DUF4373 domain-containing protein [Bacteroides sp.]|nr:DUF4373 domain-containing protein [Bacteroides sp.]
MATKEYFPHDYGARSKLVDVRKDYGLEGLGFYWCVVEILHEEGGYIKESRISGIAYDLRIETEKAEAIIRNYGLFIIKKGKIYAERVLRNLKKRAEISTARKQAANARWGNGYDTSEPPPEREPQDKNHTDVAPTDDSQEEQGFYFPFDGEEEFFRNGAEWQQRWILDRLKKMRDELNGLDEINSSYLWDIEPYIVNLMELIQNQKTVKVNKTEISTEKFLQTLTYFLTTPERLEELYNAINSVEQKYLKGEIKNKQNYLISTLYNTAKMSGG